MNEIESENESEIKPWQWFCEHEGETCCGCNALSPRLLLTIDSDEKSSHSKTGGLGISSEGSSVSELY